MHLLTDPLSQSLLTVASRHQPQLRNGAQQRWSSWGEPWCLLVDGKEHGTSRKGQVSSVLPRQIFGFHKDGEAHEALL